MAQYETKWCTVLDTHNGRSFDVKIALGFWNEKEDAEDESIFYYMDDEPLQVGGYVCEDFVVTHIEE